MEKAMVPIIEAFKSQNIYLKRYRTAVFGLETKPRGGAIVRHFDGERVKTYRVTANINT